MQIRPLAAFAFITLAAAAGWVAHAPIRSVYADSKHSSEYVSTSARMFQISGSAGHADLTVYEPELKRLYVYRDITGGNSHVNCSYMVTFTRPGGPIDRANCEVGSAY